MSEIKPLYGTDDTSYQAAGGKAGIEKLVSDFYDLMEQLPEAQHIRNMHPADLAVTRDKLATFLSGWTGGPRLYQEKYGGISIPQVHAHLEIGTEERDAWLHCMQLAVDKQDYADDFKTYLMQQLAIPAERIRQVAKTPSM